MSIFNFWSNNDTTNTEPIFASESYQPTYLVITIIGSWHFRRYFYFLTDTTRLEDWRTTNNSPFLISVSTQPANTSVNISDSEMFDKTSKEEPKENVCANPYLTFVFHQLTDEHINNGGKETLDDSHDTNNKTGIISNTGESNMTIF